MNEISSMTVHDQEELEHNLTDDGRHDDDENVVAPIGDDFAMVSASGFAYV